MIELTKEDYQWLEKLIHLEEFIDEIYTKLYECEFCNDQINFQKNIERLHILLPEEEKMYQQMKSKSQKIPFLIEHILYENEMGDSDIEAIITQKTQNRILRRILARLDNLFRTEFALLEDRRNVKQFLILDGQPRLVNVYTGETSREVDIENACSRDNYLAFLSILKKHMGNESVKEKMLKVKYDLCFIDRDVELELLENNFQIPSTFFSNLDWLVYLLDLNKEYYQETLSDYGINEVAHHIGVLLQYHDKDYEQEDLALSILLRACFIRSSLLFVDEEQFNRLKTSFQLTIDSPEYISLFNEDGMTISLVNTCFQKRRKDLLRKTN